MTTGQYSSLHPAGSAVLLCPVHLDVRLGDLLVVPGVHLLSDTLFTPHNYHTGAYSNLNAEYNQILKMSQIFITFNVKGGTEL